MYKITVINAMIFDQSLESKIFNKVNVNPLESHTLFVNALLYTQFLFVITNWRTSQVGVIFCGNQQHEAVDRLTCLNPKHSFNRVVCKDLVHT